MSTWTKEACVFEYMGQCVSSCKTRDRIKVSIYCTSGSRTLTTTALHNVPAMEDGVDVNIPRFNSDESAGRSPVAWG